MSKFEDLTGKVFGKLTVIEDTGSDDKGQRMWNCQCSCGKTKVIYARSLRQGTKSCGCSVRDRIPDLTGNIYGRLTVLGRAEDEKGNTTGWNCQCECGTIKPIPTSSLTSGSTKSCGCLAKEIAAELVGETFGKLTVIEAAGHTPVGGRLWSCICECGEPVIKSTGELRGGAKSCGCDRATDLTGQIFGKLTVTTRAENDIRNKARWNCLCDCGNPHTVNASVLVSGHSQSCGCLARDVWDQKNEQAWKELPGMIFGRLKVLKVYRVDNITRCFCVCSCGTFTSSRLGDMMAETANSCGCYAREQLLKAVITHGLTHHRIFAIHRGMKERCYNPNCPGFKHYGDRGIYICDEWRYSVQAFYDWSMANGHADHLSIDRIDNDGPYAPWNCRWATKEEQARNTSRTKLTIEDVRAIRADARHYQIIADDYGVVISHIHNIKKGIVWKDEEYIAV